MNGYVKVKWSRYSPGVAQRVGRVIALLFHDRGTREGWVVSNTPRPHFIPGKDPVPILQEAGWQARHSLRNVNYCGSRGMSVFTATFSFNSLRLHFQLLQPRQILSENKCRRTDNQTRCPHCHFIIPSHFVKKKKNENNTIFRDEQANA